MAELMGAGEFGVVASNYTYIVERPRPTAPRWTTSPGRAGHRPPNGGALLKTAENPATAMLFMDWLLTEGQEVILDRASRRRSPRETRSRASRSCRSTSRSCSNEGDEWSAKYDELLAGGEEIPEDDRPRDGAAASRHRPAPVRRAPRPDTPPDPRIDRGATPR